MDAIAAECPDILTVRSILATVRGRSDLRRPVLLSPSASIRHNLRTPLMAAAATGLMPIVGEKARGGRGLALFTGVASVFGGWGGGGWFVRGPALWLWNDPMAALAVCLRARPEVLTEGMFICRWRSFSRAWFFFRQSGH